MLNSNKVSPYCFSNLPSLPYALLLDVKVPLPYQPNLTTYPTPGVGLRYSRLIICPNNGPRRTEETLNIRNKICSLEHWTQLGMAANLVLAKRYKRIH